MTFEEFKKQARELGYNLVKIKIYTKRELCTCGAKQVQNWYYANGVKLKCKKCNRQVYGKNLENAKLNWNKEVENDMKKSLY